MGLSLLEAARSRYESLQISDDLFGESGEDSSGNPFYSTSPDSRSSSKGGSSDEDDGGCGGEEEQPSFIEDDMEKQQQPALLAESSSNLPSRPEESLAKHSSSQQAKSRAKRKAKAEGGLPGAANAKAQHEGLGAADVCSDDQARLGARLGEELPEDEGWSHSLPDVPSPSFKETSGKNLVSAHQWHHS